MKIHLYAKFGLKGSYPSMWCSIWSNTIPNAIAQTQESLDRYNKMEANWQLQEITLTQC